MKVALDDEHVTVHPTRRRLIISAYTVGGWDTDKAVKPSRSNRLEPHGLIALQEPDGSIVKGHAGGVNRLFVDVQTDDNAVDCAMAGLRAHRRGPCGAAVLADRLAAITPEVSRVLLPKSFCLGSAAT
jgi:hypothetical protein